MTTQLWPVEPAVIAVAGKAVIVGYGPMKGGFITNPQLASDQGLQQPENLYVSLIGPAAISPTATTFEVFPGGTFVIPEDHTGHVYVNASSAGHRFSGLILRRQTVTPLDSGFPPPGQTMLAEVIKSYLYQQYSDDDDLQAFVQAYNDLAQAFHDWFLNANLPIYWHPNVSGLMLDWVAEGLYGMRRPLLPTGSSADFGPLNTITLNTLTLNEATGIAPVAGFMVDDDLFRRILEWHFWKGDGKHFCIRWLKRRIKRFLAGAGATDETYDISVTFGPNNDVNINFRQTIRTAVEGALLNDQPLNEFVLNDLVTEATTLPLSPMVPMFKLAVEAGLLELPFQFNWYVNIN